MKIIICGIKTIPSSQGGVERGVEEVCSRLVNYGHKVIVYCRANERTWNNYRGFRVENIPYIDSKYMCYFSYMFNVYKDIVNNHDNDSLIHIHSPVVHGIWALLLKIKGYSIVVHNHGLEWNADKWPFWFKYYMKISETFAIHASKYFIVVSKTEHEYFCSRFKNYIHKINIIPNGIPTDSDYTKSSPVEFEKLDFYIYVGRIVPQKRLEDLIEAYHLSGTKKKLIICGGASFSNKYFKQIQEKIKNTHSIYYMGWVNRHITMNLIKNAFALILPSSSEGCPNVLLEAISMGTVSLVSDIQPHKELGGDNLYYFNVKDTNSLANKMHFLESDLKYYHELKKNISVLSTTLADWDTTTEKILELYKDIMKSDLS